jgi:hypothetical protein
MRNILKIAAVASFVLFCQISPSAFANPVSVRISLEAPQAGIDYPTGAPNAVQYTLRTAILVIDRSRIFVEKPVRLTKAQAGVDYPTDAPVDPVITSANILVLSNGARKPLVIEQARAGIDFPTDGPPSLRRNFLVWATGGNRYPVDNIRQIAKAVAGMDYPTDGPAHMNRDFYVVVFKNGRRMALR